MLKKRMDKENYRRLAELRNPKLHQFIAEYVELCNPSSVFIATDSEEDIAYVRNLALQRAAERPLAMEGHTAHFDGPKDQGRDKENTRYLVQPGVDLGERLNTIPYDEGVEEVRGLLKGIMTGKLMIVRFFCLGPVGSEFAIHCVQLTDSSYVAHSEDLLYRQGYEAFRALGDSEDFFRFVHSSGELRRRRQRQRGQAPHLHRPGRRPGLQRQHAVRGQHGRASRSWRCGWPSARPTARAGWPSTCS